MAPQTYSAMRCQTLYCGLVSWEAAVIMAEDELAHPNAAYGTFMLLYQLRHQHMWSCMPCWYPSGTMQLCIWTVSHTVDADYAALAVV